jgi:hypothetical protein
MKDMTERAEIPTHNSNSAKPTTLQNRCVPPCLNHASAELSTLTIPQRPHTSLCLNRPTSCSDSTQLRLSSVQNTQIGSATKRVMECTFEQFSGILERTGSRKQRGVRAFSGTMRPEQASLRLRMEFAAWDNKRVCCARA